MKIPFPVAVLGRGLVVPGADFRLETFLSTPKTYLDRTSALALAGCALALENAGLSGPFDENFGITLGTQFGCVETMRVFEEKLAHGGPRAASPLLFSHSYFNSPISLCAIEWTLKGHHGTFCGPTAAWDAIVAARDAIALGHAEIMLCGGVESFPPARDGAAQLQPCEASAFWVLGRARPDDSPTFDAEFGADPVFDNLADLVELGKRHNRP